MIQNEYDYMFKILLNSNSGCCCDNFLFIQVLISISLVLVDDHSILFVLHSETGFSLRLTNRSPVSDTVSISNETPAQSDRKGGT